MRYSFILAFLILSACAGQKEEKGLKTYMDVKGFFDAEASRLSSDNPEINKTVARNDASETKNMKNINWKTELSLFAESDINKPAWKDSYKVINGAGKTIYVAADSSLRTREINITKDSGGRIRKITILNQVDNMLYSSTEQLLYIPDSVYQISKQQHVAIIGDNRYFINGKF